MNKAELQRQMDKEERFQQNDLPLPEPDWSSAPDWAQFWAVDADGMCYWYAQEPHPQEKVWSYSAPDKFKIGGFVYLPPHLDWKTMLRQRPEAQPTTDQLTQAYQAVEGLHGGWVLPETLREWMVEELDIDQELTSYELQLRRAKRRILLTELQRLQPYLRPDDQDD